MSQRKWVVTLTVTLLVCSTLGIAVLIHDWSRVGGQNSYPGSWLIVVGAVLGSLPAVFLPKRILDKILVVRITSWKPEETEEKQTRSSGIAAAALGISIMTRNRPELSLFIDSVLLIMIWSMGYLLIRKYLVLKRQRAGASEFG